MQVTQRKLTPIEQFNPYAPQWLHEGYPVIDAAIFECIALYATHAQWLHDNKDRLITEAQNHKKGVVFITRACQEHRESIGLSGIAYDLINSNINAAVKSGGMVVSLDSKVGTSGIIEALRGIPKLLGCTLKVVYPDSTYIYREL